MSVATYTKSGGKAPTTAKLDKQIFNVEVTDHGLLKSAYLAYLAGGRANLAKTKRRGEVSGGGRKPWRQKGTGRARFGSSRNPIWRGGGIAFGPTGNENYTKKVNLSSKRKALRQALTLAAAANKVSVIEGFDCKDGKTATAKKLLHKMGLSGSLLIALSEKNAVVERATRNLTGVKVTHVDYLNVYDVLNCDHLLISQESLEQLKGRLGESK